MIMIRGVCGISALKAFWALIKSETGPLRLQQVFFPKCNVYDPPVRRNYSIIVGNGLYHLILPWGTSQTPLLCPVDVNIG